MWFDKLWQNTVDLFRSLDIPVRTLECCSRRPRRPESEVGGRGGMEPAPEKKYFEVGSCSNFGRRTGTPLENPCQGRGRQKIFGTYLEQYRGCSPAYADCIFGEQFAGRRQRAHSRSTASVYGRQNRNPLIFILARLPVHGAFGAVRGSFLWIKPGLKKA